MRLIYYFSSLLILCLPFQLAADQKMANAQELREVLVSGHTPLTLAPIKVEHGCFESDCFEIVDKISINKETGAVFKGFRGQQLSISIFPNQDNLVPIDWTPISAYRVLSKNRTTWGNCLEFSHSGLGKSGRFQRWNSIILLPWLHNKPGDNAYRFEGYWGNCNALIAGDTDQYIILPELVLDSEQQNTLKLKALNYVCNAKACSQNSLKLNFGLDANTSELILMDR